MPKDLSIRFCDNALPFVTSSATRESLQRSIRLLEKNCAWRWKNERMEALCTSALLNAALSGDGIFYCWWDPALSDGQPFRGNVRTTLIDSTDLFVADVNSSDLQAQEYVLLSGRERVSVLRREAREAGLDEKTVAAIVGDGEETDGVGAGDHSAKELRGGEKATFLIRFHRENGEVVFQKFTRGALIKTVHTGLSRYPLAYFHWRDTKGSYLGSAPVGDMIANQKYINSAYALAMKHMSDTAFSKVIYDKSRIPEWSNEVGEAIAALGGGNVSDAVSVVGVGKMQEGYLDLITSVIENTKAMMSATDSALGDERANNTSAILALQEASKLGLKQVRSALCRAIAELAEIWADMLSAYAPAERMLAFYAADGTPDAATPDYALLRNAFLQATAEAGEVNRYTPAATVAVLDKLLEGGHIDLPRYLELLPEGVLANRESLLATLTEKGE